MSNIDKRPFRADGGDISTGRLKEIADNPYGDEEKCWMAKRMLALLDELEAAEQERKNWRTSFDNERFRADKLAAEMEARGKQIADDLQIKARLCRESNSLHDRLREAEKRIAELPGKKRLIGWRMADYTDETADPALAKNWATAVDVLPIFEGDVNTKLSAAAAGKGEAL